MLDPLTTLRSVASGLLAFRPWRGQAGRARGRLGFRGAQARLAGLAVRPRGVASPSQVKLLKFIPEL